MSGGEIASLNQGDNLDTFAMSGGRIVDGFDDGDRAVMTGGRIGRVNMKLDDNLFDMSGGTIDRNLVAGFGNDTVVLRDGTDRRQHQRQRRHGFAVGDSAEPSAATSWPSFGDDAFTWEGGGHRLWPDRPRTRRRRRGATIRSEQRATSERRRRSPAGSATTASRSAT